MKTSQDAPPAPAADPRRPSWRRLASFWAAFALFFLVLALFAAFYDRFPGDERIAHATQDIDVPAFGGFLDFINLLGTAWLVLPLTIGLAVAFALARHGTEAMLVLLAFAARGVNGFVKEVVERPRPSPDLVDVTNDASGFSFPSGHTLGTAVLFGLLFFLIPAAVPWRPVRWLFQAACLLAVVAAGPARVYVGVHWPSDAFAGYLLALLLLAPVLTLYYALRPASTNG